MSAGRVSQAYSEALVALERSGKDSRDFSKALKASACNKQPLNMLQVPQVPSLVSSEVMNSYLRDAVAIIMAGKTFACRPTCTE